MKNSNKETLKRIEKVSNQLYDLLHDENGKIHTMPLMDEAGPFTDSYSLLEEVEENALNYEEMYLCPAGYPLLDMNDVADEAEWLMTWVSKKLSK